MNGPADFVPERIQPVAGGRLRGADLRDLLTLADHQRRRHVRALHATWGIAAGLRFSQDDHGGPIIQPGVAYDRCGRLLVLRGTVELPLPVALAVPSIVVLRGDGAAGEPAASLWLRATSDEVEPGVDIVLGTMQSVGGGILWDDAGRRYARTAAPVTLAAGLVRRGTLPATGTLQVWSVDVSVHPGFSDLPVYVADVGSTRPPGGEGIATVEVSEIARTGFRITVRRASNPNPAGGAGGALNSPSAGQNSVHTTPEDISWIAAAPQTAAHVPYLFPPTGPYPGFPSEREH